MLPSNFQYLRSVLVLDDLFGLTLDLIILRQARATFSMEGNSIPTAAQSDSTISRTRDSKLVLGDQPSSALALAAFPCRISTSAGR